jgi:type II secretory pathway predicted ATPase ExeA
MKIAGRADTLFSHDAVTLIHNASRSYPRAIHNLTLVDQRPPRQGG